VERIIIFLIWMISLSFSLPGVKGQEISAIEDSLAKTFNKLDRFTSIEEIDSCHNNFLSHFHQTIQLNESFEYPFKKLEKIGKVTSGDGLVRCYSWNLLTTDGSYRYFAFIQIQSKQGNKIIFQLNDNPNQSTIPENTKLVPLNWYGALYYKIFHVPNKEKDQYILLGWDGNNNRSMKKIIDVLEIHPDQTISLGAPIFVENNQVKHRKVFEYSSKGKMTLTYHKKTKRIVFDHLVPIHPRYKGIFEFYGPDYSFDSYIWDNAHWIFKSNINPDK